MFELFVEVEKVALFAWGRRLSCATPGKLWAILWFAAETRRATARVGDAQTHAMLCMYG
jgi:hypothetical protein